MTTVNLNQSVGLSQDQNARPSIVILGGGYAGMSSALRLARHSHAQIHLVNPQSRFVERIRLHEVASGRNLRMISIPHLLRGKGVIFHEARANHIDWRARQVTLSDGSRIGYDRLIYALGSQTDLSTPGAAENTLALEGFAGSQQVMARLAALPAQSAVVIVGGGLTGTELVTELVERYPNLRWTMVAREAYEQGFAPIARDHFLKGLARRGINFRSGVTVQRVEPHHLVTNAGDVPFDLCLWAGSFRGAPLGRISGLAVDEKDRVLVDETMRSLTTPDIYVAGDSAALPAAYQPYMVMGCKTAMPEAFQVAENLLGELRGESPQPLHFSYTATCVSLGRHDGVVQFLKPDGEAAHLVVRGRNAAFVKELICRLTVWTLQLERHFNFYDLLMPKRQVQASPQPQPVPSQGI